VQWGAQPPVTKLTDGAAAGAHKLMTGLCAGVARGAMLILDPGFPEEETVTVDQVHLRRDGLSVTLAAPLQHDHPGSSFVHLYPEAEVHFNRARMHLDGATDLYDEEVTVRVP